MWECTEMPKTISVEMWIFEKAEPIVEAITPVPGGVGSVTTSVLVGHVVEAAKRKFA